MVKSNLPEGPDDSLRLGRGKNFLVVGIGASAGGINALKEFFEEVPADSGMAYVVILHLSPTYESKLTEILQTVTPMPVARVEEEVNVAINNVYVVAPNKSLSMIDGLLIASPIKSVEERRAPVDMFFRTLAESHHDRAVGVVLSGTGANGSMGLKRIKENGGVVFVQSPREAEFNEMPRNAISTDLIDAILPVREIPQKVMAYKGNLGFPKISIDLVQAPEDQQEALRDIFTHLRLKTGHDFSNYKRASILRRLERRISVNNLHTVAAYADFVRDTPEETQLLLKDLLISVTNFFRDAKAFTYLEQEIIPRVLAEKTGEDKIRVWVAGCATGEEAYSIAMLFAEKLRNVVQMPVVQIFATDIDDDALAQGREGLYTLNDVADVSPERLRRFFAKEGDEYRVRRELREMVLFANHNLIKDPPFSKLDLVTCRNLLIYLNQSAQTRVMQIFHFALLPGKFLFLGSSESVDGSVDIFPVLNKEFRFYQSRQVGARPLPVPDTSPTFRIDSGRFADNSQGNEKRTLERITFSELHQQLLEEYAPPSLVVTHDFEVVHLSENAGRYLLLTGGEPSTNLLKLIKQDLRLDLRSGLYQAVQQQTKLVLRNLRIMIDDEPELVNIHIRPVVQRSDAARGFILVIFEKGHEDSTFTAAADAVSPDPVARQLEDELVRSKAQLKGSIEQYEVQTEELKASNEELQAMNEELRSSAEELETSKEELQSINEELTTVNQELKVKIEELSNSNNNFQNLINSTDIGTIFLDRSFRVNLFTSAARQIFNLIPNDIGRALSDISNRLIDTNILEDAERVIDTLQNAEREVTTNDQKVFAMRLFPYRTSEDKISGVVVTFIDVTRRKNMEIELRQSEENFRMLIESTTDYAIITFDTDLVITGWNRGAQRIFGYSAEEAIGQKTALIYTREDQEAGVIDTEVGNAKEHGRAEDERWHVRKDGSRLYISGVVNLLKQQNKGFVKIARDMTVNKLLEQQKDEFIVIASHELKTPVTIIKAYTEVLAEMITESDFSSATDLMAKLDAQVDRLGRLISDLLDTTRLSEGQLAFDKTEFDLNALIEQVRENMIRIAGNHRLVTHTRPLPGMFADRERIGQVLINLISNAIKYSPSGGDIIINSDFSNQQFKLSVQDRGIGMNEETRKSLFHRFYRAKNPVMNTFPGLGLGLYISNEIIKRHGGTILVESEEGKGSSFTVIIPSERTS